MNIFIITLGSRGDVQPYVALGLGLRAAGHTVTICTASRFESFITDHGLAYGYMTDELLQLMDTGLGRDAIENTIGLFGTFKTMIKLVKFTKPITRRMIIESWEAAQLAGPDLVIFHPKAMGAVSIAEKLDVPVMMAALQPMMVPTGAFPLAGLPALPIGGWYNRSTYGLIKLGYRTYAGIINDFRRDKLGLDPFPKSSGLFFTAKGKPIPILHGFSAHVVPRPADWPDQAMVNGYWFLDRLNTWQPPPQLEAFLDKGSPPVYVGFGSMAGRHPRRLAHIVIEALEQTNLRGVLATGAGGLETADLPDTILNIDTAPHDWLFPRLAAIVHHGGAGTTAAGLRAGRPMLICPFIADQPFWGKRIHALGVGPQPVPQKKLSVKKLANALQAITNDETMRQKAEKLSTSIQGEKGVGNTVAAIEDVLSRSKN